MSWVFLTKNYVYKLKKPVRSEFLDFSTIAARYQDCQAELQLNRRLAPHIYLAIVPLIGNSQGKLQLGTRHEIVDGKEGIDANAVVDWLVKMRRLPAHAMLDVAIQQETIKTHDLQRVAEYLVHFYQSLPPVKLSAMDYRDRLQADLEATKQSLTHDANGLPNDLICKVLNALIAFLQAESLLFEQRIEQGKIIEGHGDLRPEHVCLQSEVAIIDCLEFSQSLRILDCVDELAFLALECERLGAAWVGETILNCYYHSTHDRPPPCLIQFYKAYRACLRAKLAIWHMEEPGRLAATDWFDRAHSYLCLAQKFLPQLL